MTNSSKLAIAGLISVALRRKINRVIDVEWMLLNEAYAKEVMSIARKQNVIELSHYADRLEELLFGKATPVQTEHVVHHTNKDAVSGGNAVDEIGIENQYIGALR